VIAILARTWLRTGCRGETARLDPHDISVGRGIASFAISQPVERHQGHGAGGQERKVPK